LVSQDQLQNRSTRLEINQLVAEAEAANNKHVIKDHDAEPSTKPANKRRGSFLLLRQQSSMGQLSH